MGLLESLLHLNGTPYRWRGLADQSLLGALAQLDVYLPAACGGHGSCGLCKCRLPDSAEAPSSLEKPYLSAAEQATGWRLACQVAPRAGLSVEVDPEILKAHRIAVRVEQITSLSPTIRQLSVCTVSGKPLDFVPGQWAGLVVGFGSGEEHRAFSYGSGPGNDRTIFLVARVPGGRVSTFIHEELAPGDRLEIIGPFGDFRIDTRATGPMLWIAGGSGLAPFRAILDDLVNHQQLNGREIHLFFSNHRPEEVFLDDWLRQLALDHQNFHYWPSVSENPDGLPWDGQIGRLPQVLRSRLADILGSAPGGAATWQAYLCGSAGLVEVGRAIVRQAGVPDNAIFFDRFI